MRHEFGLIGGAESELMAGMLKVTPLYETHQQLGGRLIEFGGWEMPVQFAGIVDEHMAVREAAGIFDISHMGEVMVAGPAAERFLNRILTNDVTQLAPGHGQYSIMCSDDGGTIDDLYVYRQSALNFLLVINASRIGEDVSWILKRFDEEPDRAGTHVIDVSSKYGAVAVQGPAVRGFIDKCFDGGTLLSGPDDVNAASALKKNQLLNLEWHGNSLWIACTGYTGEDGFEIIATEGVIVDVWRQVMEIGAPRGLVPAGLGARDTLRTEVCYPLYGHELSETISPIEAGLGFFVKLDKGEFIGRSTLAAQKESGPARKSVAFKMTGRTAPPRPHYPVHLEGGDQIGEVTSGTQSPSLGCGIGLALVGAEHASVGSKIEVEIRGRRHPAEIVKKPFYKAG